MKKKIITILICLIFISDASLALPQTTWEKREEEKISSSIAHEHILKFTPEGWFNINVIKADMHDPLNEITLMKSPKGFSERETVKNMVETTNAIAGINASFFNKNSTAIGTVIKDGEILTTSNTADTVPSISINSNDDIFFYTNNTEIHLNDLTQGFSLINIPINRFGYNGDNPISVLTPAWGKESIGSKYSKEIIEVLVIDDVVHDIRQGGAPFQIPSNGYVISVIKGTLGYRSVDKMMVGDRLSFIYPDESFRNIKLSIPGGSIILRNGMVLNQGIEIKGKHPRSAVGVDAQNRYLYLVTVDGRHTSYKGVDQKTLGEIMQSLGCYNAINLDGGGSTNLAVKYKGDSHAKIINRPSQKGRKVITGIGIKTQDMPIGEIDSLKLNFNPHFFILNGKALNLTAKDIHQNKVPLDNSMIEWSVEGIEGEFKDNKFTPKSEGKGVITAKVGDKSISQEITVSGKVIDLTCDIDKIYLEPGEMIDIPVFSAVDDKGVSAPVKEMGLSVFGNVGEIMGDKFIAGMNSNTGYLSGMLAGGVENIPIYVGSNKVPANDLLDHKRQTVSVAPKGIEGARNAKDGNITLTYDFSKNTETRACYLNLDEKSAAIIPTEAVSLGLTVKGDGNGTWLRGVVNDGEKNHYIDFVRNLDTIGTIQANAKLPSVGKPLKLIRIYAVEDRPESQYKGSVSFSNLTINYPLPLGKVQGLPQETTFKDPHEDRPLSGEMITIASEPILNDLEFDYNSLVNYISGDTVISFNGFNHLNLGGRRLINAKGLYSVNHTLNTEILSLSASKGSIWTTASPQWPAIKNLEHSDKKNIVVLLDKRVMEIVDKLEGDLFRKYMADIVKSGKNVIVVQYSNQNAKYLKDGVRYLEINRNILNKAEDIKDITILEMVFNEGDFSYSFIKPYK